MNRDHAQDPHQHRQPFIERIRHLMAPHRHDHAASTDAALEASDEGIRALKVSLAGLGATALLQLAVVLVSGSVALLADTIHNFSDALTAIPLWIAFALGRRAATTRYTHGYGRGEDLAGLFIVLMIAASAALAGWESARRLIDPPQIEHVWLVFTAGLVGGIGNEVVARYRIRAGRRIGSAALVADGHHARADALTSVAVSVGAIGVAAGFPLADPVIGLGVTLAILVVLRQAAGEVFGRLMDRVDPGLSEQLRAGAAAVPGVAGVDRAAVRWVGNRLVAELSIRVDATLSFPAAHGIASAVESALTTGIPRLSTVTVHASPSAVGERPALSAGTGGDEADSRHRATIGHARNRH